MSITPITMPKWGIEMTEGTVSGWSVRVGQRVGKGDPILDVETEKIVNVVEAPANGVVRRLLAEVGEVRPVGSLIAVFADERVADAEIDAFVRNFRGATVSFEPDAPAPAPAPVGAGAAAGRANDAEARVSPIARRLAEKHGVDLAAVRGTGRDGRVSKEDVEAFVAARAAGGAGNAPPAAAIPATTMTAATAPARRRLSATRATIARRLLEASQTIPHFRLAVEVSAEALLARRSTLATQGGERVTVTDCLVYAASRALLAHRDVNVQFAGEEIAAYDSADVAVAVATPAGLVTPIIRGAHALDLVAISRAVRGLAERARAGTLTREDITGGTFTISNLGMHGVDRFDAIINPPQVAILAAGAVAPRVVARDGRAVVSQQLTLTLSCDHRVIDGAVGAAFLAEVRRRLEAADFA